MLFSPPVTKSRAKNGPGTRSWTARKRKPILEVLEQREVLSTLVLPTSNIPTFTATFNKILSDGTTIQVTGQPVSGGNFLGTLDGTSLTATYCTDINATISPPVTYPNAVVTSDGTIYGTAVANAGQIAWLVDNLGPTAKTPEQQDALQAAIWRTEYGTTFQLDSVDNTNGAPAFNMTIGPIYMADLAALGANFDPLNAVSWISPGSSTGSGMDQGLVAVPPVASTTTPDVAIAGTATPGTLAVGQNLTYTLTVTNTGTVPATGATVTDTLPQGVTFVSATGGVTPVNGVVTFNVGDLAVGASSQAFTIVIQPTSTGTLTNTAVASLPQADPTPADNTVTLMTSVTSTVTTTDGPLITGVAREGFHAMPTTLILTFNTMLDATSAEDVNNYRIIGPGGQAIAIVSATYDPSTDTVTLQPSQQLNLHKIYTLAVNGSTPTGVSDTSGNLLDGTNSGKPGSDYTTQVTAANLVMGPNVPGGQTEMASVLRKVKQILREERAFHVIRHPTVHVASHPTRHVTAQQTHTVHPTEKHSIARFKTHRA